MTDRTTGLPGIDELDTRRAMAGAPPVAAERYWQVTSALAACHLLAAFVAAREDAPSFCF